MPGQRAALRTGYAALLRERVARNAPPVRISPPPITVTRVGTVRAESGCLLCGVGSVLVDAAEVARAGGRLPAARLLWTARRTSVTSLGTQGAEMVSGHLCPTCDESVEHAGGLDARIGHISRDHGDVEFWVERVDADRSKAVLVTAGAAALGTQPPTESCEFTWNGTDFSTAYFDRRPDGGFSQPEGRFADWLFPPGSFTDELVTLGGFPVLAMSAAGMLAMKEQFPQLRNGRPWRLKDIADIATLRDLVGHDPQRCRLCLAG